MMNKNKTNETATRRVFEDPELKRIDFGTKDILAESKEFKDPDAGTWI